MLSLTESLTLLCLNDEKGNVIFTISTQFPFGLAGSLILDLYRMKKIKIDQEEIVMIDNTPTGLNYLDYALEKMKKKGDFEDIHYWINEFESDMSTIKEKILSALVDSGILRKEEHKVLWVISYDRFPTENPLPELELRKNIRDIVNNDSDPDENLLYIISLVKACELTYEIFPEKERNHADQRIKTLCSKEYLQGHTSKENADVIFRVVDLVDDITGTTIN